MKVFAKLLGLILVVWVALGWLSGVPYNPVELILFIIGFALLIV
jgi:hypothetical protein